MWNPHANISRETPDAENYEILHVEQVGKNLVLRVQCDKCSYDGVKVMVFLNVTTIKAMKWKRIDPHFGDPMLKSMPTDAPRHCQMPWPTPRRRTGM